MLKIALVLFVSACASANILNLGLDTSAKVGGNGAQVSVGVNTGANLGAGIGGMLGGLFNATKGMIGTVTDQMHNIEGQVEGGIQGAIGMGKDLLGGLTSKMQDMEKTMMGLIAAGAEIPQQMFQQMLTISGQIQANIQDMMGKMCSAFHGLSGDLQNKLQGGADQLKAGLDGALTKVLTGAAQIRGDIQKQMAAGEEQLATIKKQLEDMASQGCSKSKELIGQLEGQAQLTMQKLETGLASAKQNLMNNVAAIDAQLKTATGDLQKKLLAAKDQLVDEIQKLEAAKMKLINDMLAKGQDLIKQGAAYADQLKANINAAVQGIATDVQGGMAKIQTALDAQAQQAMQLVSALYGDLVHLQQEGTAQAKAAAEKLQKQITDTLAQYKANLEAELSAIQAQLKTAQGAAAQALSDLAAKLEAKIADIKKKLDAGVSVNINAGVGGNTGAQLGVQIGANAGQ